MKIGGFFPLHLPERAKKNSVLALWGVPAHPHLFFGNARSALSCLLQLKKPAILWLPAYSCMALAEAAGGTRLRFFPLRADLSPDADFLKSRVKPGEAVVAIDYFGRGPGPEFLKLVRSAPDILWIEDRAQAFLPAREPWGDYVLYSPRKLLGVPDGGILVSRWQALPAPEQPGHEDAGFLRAALLRYEDRDEKQNDVWYAAYTEQEENMQVSLRAMSRISRCILAAADPAPLMRKRKANYDALMAELGDIALLPAAADFVPFGFPVRVPERAKLASGLHAQGIFAAHHWPELPSPASQFAAEHRLAERLLTLPVDHRYGRREMRRIAAAVRKAL